MSELFHDGAMCPECNERIGTPDIAEGGDPSAIPEGDKVRNMICPCCGERWRVESSNDLARAWFALGAYEQSMKAAKR